MIALALDYGERRIGVAISDPQGLSARPLTVITRETREKDLERVRQLAAQFGVGVVVIGLPLNMDGTEGLGARRARRFGNAIKHGLGLAVELWDERLTTFEADQQMLEAGLSLERRKELRDAVAAAVILGDYLEENRRVAGSESEDKNQKSKGKSQKPEGKRQEGRQQQTTRREIGA